MLSLRTADGLDLAALGREFGPEAPVVLAPVLEGHEARGLVELTRSGGSDSGSGGGGGGGGGGSGTASSSRDGGGGSRGGGGGSRDGGGGRSAEAAGPAAAGAAGAAGAGTIVRARLTDPEGFLLSNAVISDLFAAF
jgi:hypothetical protein